MKGSPSVLAPMGPGRGELIWGGAECTWSFCRTCLLFSFLGQEGDFTPGLLEGRSAPVTVYATCLDSRAHRHKTGHRQQEQGHGGLDRVPFTLCPAVSRCGWKFTCEWGGWPAPPTPGPSAPRWCIPAQGCRRGRERLYSSYWMFWGQMRKRGLGPLLRGISSPCKLLTCYQNHCGVSTIQEAGDSSSRI